MMMWESDVSVLLEMHVRVRRGPNIRIIRTHSERRTYAGRQGVSDIDLDRVQDHGVTSSGGRVTGRLKEQHGGAARGGDGQALQAAVRATLLQELRQGLHHGIAGARVELGVSHRHVADEDGAACARLEVAVNNSHRRRVLVNQHALVRLADAHQVLGIEALGVVTAVGLQHLSTALVETGQTGILGVRGGQSTEVVSIGVLQGAGLLSNSLSVLDVVEGERGAVLGSSEAVSVQLDIGITRISSNKGRVNLRALSVGSTVADAQVRDRSVPAVDTEGDAGGGKQQLVSGDTSVQRSFRRRLTCSCHRLTGQRKLRASPCSTRALYAQCSST